MASDIGFSHVALQVSDIDKSVAFYEKWAAMSVVDRLEDPKTGNKAARLSDGRGSCEIALVQSSLAVEHRLGGLCHVGIGCADRSEVDRVCAEAEKAGCLSRGPIDSGFPLGYWGFLADPDGHQLEVSYGQNDPNA